MSSNLPPIDIGTQSLNRFGLGYNTLTGRYGGQIVQSANGPVSGGQTTLFKLSRITTISDLHSELDISASMSYNEGVTSGDLKASYSNSVTIHDYSS